MPYILRNMLWNFSSSTTNWNFNLKPKYFIYLKIWWKVHLYDPYVQAKYCFGILGGVVIVRFPSECFTQLLLDTWKPFWLVFLTKVIVRVNFFGSIKYIFPSVLGCKVCLYGVAFIHLYILKICQFFLAEEYQVFGPIA